LKHESIFSLRCRKKRISFDRINRIDRIEKQTRLLSLNHRKSFLKSEAKKNTQNTLVRSLYPDNPVVNPVKNIFNNVYDELIPVKINRRQKEPL